jgi:hypothetical protein
MYILTDTCDAFLYKKWSAPAFLKGAKKQKTLYGAFIEFIVLLDFLRLVLYIHI